MTCCPNPSIPSSDFIGMCAKCANDRRLAILGAELTARFGDWRKDAQFTIDKAETVTPKPTRTPAQRKAYWKNYYATHKSQIKRRAAK